MDASANSLGLPVERFHGIEVKIENQKLTEKIVYPVTWADWKTEKLLSIVQETKRRHPGKQVVVLAAFGDSYGADGPFVKYVATQTLRKDKPLSVIINAGEAPLEYTGLFMSVKQSEVMSDVNR